MTRYRGTEIVKTNITTNPNNNPRKVAYLYELRGAVNKPAGHRPFLTTANACKEYIRGVLLLRQSSLNAANVYVSNGE